MQEIKFIENTHLKEKPKDQSKLGFGKIFTDYMFTMEYNSKEGWHNAQVRPYENLSFDPATTFIHYGQALFEGMKAYKWARRAHAPVPPDGELRARHPAPPRRLCMPGAPGRGAGSMAGLKLAASPVDAGLDSDGVRAPPSTSGRSSWSPRIAFLGVHARRTATCSFIILLSPGRRLLCERACEPGQDLRSRDEYVRAGPRRHRL